MQTLLFRCRLANGLHARPASALEQQAARFAATVTLINLTKSRRASAKSVLAMVGADVAPGDECQLQIEGEDEQQALLALRHFIENEFEHSDEPQAGGSAGGEQLLPVFLSRSRSKIWQGTGVRKGIAIAKAVYLQHTDLDELARQQEETPPDVQQRQLGKALEDARRQLRADIARHEGEAAQLLDAQSQLLEDETVEECLLGQSGTPNAIAALARAVDALREPFQQSGSDYLRQRELDVYDLGLRLACQLTGEARMWLPELNEGSILVCRGLLTPSQLLLLRGANLRGIVMPKGGETSHTAILAGVFAIPLLCPDSTGELFAQPAGELLLAADCGLLLSDLDEVARRWFQLEGEKQRRLPSASGDEPEGDMLSESLVLLNESLREKHEVIKRLTDNLDVQQRIVSATQAEHAIWQREEVFTTALGFSIAILQCKSVAISRSSISVLRLNEPLEWGSGVAVKLVIMVTLSEGEGQQHMRIFSVLARRLMHESFRESLMAAGSPREMLNLLRDEVMISS
ncbi:HPr family phosphocarrier protein [Cedecea davisae]|uniref:HPr family phosphocarrier protein n=1 Tax=Cedecea davisae TaxID=158484 RepID=UPI00242A7BE8|nr:HPr family phosphocarrier protein [Cedecea davisae]